MAMKRKAGVTGQAETNLESGAPKPVRRVDQELEAINARNKQALSTALSKAKAVKIAPPAAVFVPPAAMSEAKKPAKVKKIKLIRDGFAMPEHEYAALSVLKRRLAAMEYPVKKSELIRGGIALLAALDDAELQAVMSSVERMKTGRPKK